LMKVLYEREIDSLLVEGGARTLSSFMEAGLVDEIYTFIAPKILNDFDALSPFPGEGGSGLMSDAIQLQRVSIQTYGQDVLVHGYLTEL
ncbi:MAG: dihydrofolate reductase family protein, partial [Candidatus Omnitrophica bacterium]|nr:dihydrofolate reductase family protein [Candidatus Omnitrophota bacterium]